MQTSELLDQLGPVDDSYLKRHYNYNLDTNRNNYEAVLEVRREFQTRADDPDKVKMWSDILKSDTIAMKKKKIKDDKVKKIFTDKIRDELFKK